MEMPVEVEMEMPVEVEMLLEEISCSRGTNPTEKNSLVSGQHLLDTSSNNFYSHLRIVVGTLRNYSAIHQECTAYIHKLFEWMIGLLSQLLA